MFDGNEDEESSALAELAEAETTCDNDHAVKAPAVRHDDRQSTVLQPSSVASGEQPEPLRRELLSKGSPCRSNTPLILTRSLAPLLFSLAYSIQNAQLHESTAETKISRLIHCLPMTPRLPF